MMHVAQPCSVEFHGVRTIFLSGSGTIRHSGNSSLNSGELWLSLSVRTGTLFGMYERNWMRKERKYGDFDRLEWRSASVMMR